VTPTVRIRYSETELPETATYAKQWMQLKVVKEDSGVIILSGTDHVIGSMLSDIRAYAKRHNLSVKVDFRVYGEESICPSCLGEMAFYYSNPDDNGYFCDKCNKEYPSLVVTENTSQKEDKKK
jgi:hypothetical protein